MKKYSKPNTSTLVLSANDRLCQTDIASVGGNGGFTFGGEGLPGYNPM